MRAITVLACIAMFASGGAHAVPRPSAAGQAVTQARPVTEPADIAAWLRRLVGRYSVEGMVEVTYPGYRCVPDPDEPGAGDPPPEPVPYCKAMKGKGDCTGIGTGPGVQCVLNVTWEDLYEVVYPKELKPNQRYNPLAGVYNLPGGVSSLGPSMLLFGLDPGKSAINHLLVDNKGLPEGGLGSIAGDRATFKTPCVNAPTMLEKMKPPPQPAEPPLFRQTPRTCERTLRIDAEPDARLLHMSIDFAINDEIWTRYTMSLRRVPQTGEVPAPAKPSASR